MHRIDTPTAQKDKFGAGKNGFTAGNPQTGTPSTDLDNDYFDMLQEELAGVVEATGVNLEKSKHNQLLTAMKALLLSRAHPFADIKADGAAAIAEALSNLGFGSFPQYQSLGAGQHLFQHGSGGTNSSGIVDIVFPKAYTTTDNLNVIATATAGTPSNYIVTIGPPTLTGVRIYVTGANAGNIPAPMAIGFNWFATGR
ncbi:MULTISPECIES: hypothetical protein [Citrobacter]|uniref:hypothetical protein n=1 Tax=Citrobacter TaxID=544 RepID=UPI001F2BD63E|nr:MULTISPECIES: hypothetical protein [Citrobacter]